MFRKIIHKRWWASHNKNSMHVYFVRLAQLASCWWSFIQVGSTTVCWHNSCSLLVFRTFPYSFFAWSKCQTDNPKPCLYQLALPRSLLVSSGSHILLLWRKKETSSWLWGESTLTTSSYVTKAPVHLTDSILVVTRACFSFWLHVAAPRWVCCSNKHRPSQQCEGGRGKEVGVGGE